jgi:hypothetical protein
VLRVPKVPEVPEVPEVLKLPGCSARLNLYLEKTSAIGVIATFTAAIFSGNFPMI